ncbi:MAG: STAS domain-containing protein [Oscillatoriales cyanobacterium C42_A2020_001]|nr:STAS domain-containing protein [Leptolyngbyaceae cyanobacterium C42_A2020_001]
MTSDRNFRVIQPEGILSASVAKQMLQQFEESQKEGIKLLLIDLQNVAMIDSFGLGIIVSIHSKLKLAGGKLYLCGLQKQARFLFDISALDRMFDILPDHQAFYQAIQENSLV